MEQLIEKLQVNEDACKGDLEWLSKDIQNSISDSSPLVKYLLVRQLKLEQRIAELELEINGL